MGPTRAATMICLLVLGAPCLAQADQISVTTQSDEHDADQKCSLREAIIAANNDGQGPGGDCAKGSGADVITLPASANHYTLTLGPAGDDAAASGDLDITSDLTLSGGGTATTIVDADHRDRVLQIIGNPTVDIHDVTITGGKTPDGAAGAMGPVGANGDPAGASNGGAGLPSDPGGGILTSGQLTLTRVVLSGNATGAGGQGGAASKGGEGTGNSQGGNSRGGHGGISGDGGGIAATAGNVTVVDSTVAANASGAGGAGGAGSAGGTGGPGSGSTGRDGGGSNGGGGGASGSGGGIWIGLGTGLTLTRTTLSENATGAGGAGGGAGPGGAGGDGTSTGGGGGSSIGGAGGSGGRGAAVYEQSSIPGTIRQSTITGNRGGNGGPGGNGGTGGASGAGTTLGFGGPSQGTLGGNGGDFPVYLDGPGGETISDSTIAGNLGGAGGPGGDGGTGGAGFGASNGRSFGGVGPPGGSSAVFLNRNAGSTITNVTVVANRSGAGAHGGSGGTGPIESHGGSAGAGGAEAGLFVTEQHVPITHVTVALNQTGVGGMGGDAGTGAVGTSGTNGATGQGGGLTTNAGSAILRNSLFASNDAGFAKNCSGTFDAASAHNLSFPEDGTCPADLHTDPLLGPLQDNGGLTPTSALGAGSPALDAVPASGAGCEPKDERGIARPKGAGCDIGAYELSPPLATTGVASEITQTSATVAGTVNPGQVSTTSHFEFGKTTAYGSSTPTTPAGNGTADVPVTESLGGLDPDSVYHFRLVATSSDGTSAGSDATFTTPPAPIVEPPFVFPGVSILTGSARVDKKGRAPIRLSCPALTVQGCDGTLTLSATVKSKRAFAARKRKLTLGKKPFSILPGKTATVKVKLSKTGLTALRKAKKLKAGARAVAHDGLNVTKTQDHAVTLKAPKGKRKR